MEKGYEKFIEDLRRAVLDATGVEESKVHFEERGGKYTATGDKLFVECAVHEDAREVCGIYTEELYKRFKKDITMDDIVEEVILELKRVEQANFFQKTQNLSDYEKTKENLFIRLLSLDRNKKELKHAVYRTVGDIALVLYMKVGEAEGCITSMKIPREYVQKWEMDSEKVFEEALVNTYFMTPPRIYRWEKLLFNPEYEGDNFMDLLSEYELNREAVGNCLSTTKRTNGAVAVFLPGVAKRLGELMGEDFYLVFTSIHEVMIHNDQKVYPEDLSGVLKDTLKEATPEEDYLTSRIYHYNRKEETFSCV